jgi:co-chaperonin GroES (HSP10)
VKLRPVGPRVFVRPDAEPEPDPSAIILADTDYREKALPTSGVIVDIGHGLCRECLTPIAADLSVGQRVAIWPGAVVQEIDWDGDTLWSLPFDAIIGVVSEELAHV